MNNLSSVVNVARSAGFQDMALAIAVSIAMAESSGNPAAIGDTTLVNEKWGPSVGLWQIRTLHHPEQYTYPDTLRICEYLLNPMNNAHAAYAISKNGQDFSAWSTYTNSAYQKYINDVLDYLNNTH